MKKYRFLLFLICLTYLGIVKAQNKFEVSADGYYQQHNRAISENIFGLNVTGGYRISNYFRFGLTTGLGNVVAKAKSSQMEVKDVLFIPLKGQIKGNFLKKGISPYMGIEGGCCFYLKDGHNPGYTCKLFLGADIPITPSLSAYGQVGYNLQAVSTTYIMKGGYVSITGYPSYYPDTKTTLRRSGELIEFAAGITYSF